MWVQTSHRVNVLVWLAEPLLRLGVRAALGSAPLLNVFDNAQPWGGGVQVVITDWDSASLVAQRGNSPGIPSLMPHSRILVISAQAREYAVASALRMGIHGVILSRCTADELVAAVQVLAQGSTYLCPEVAQRLAANCSRDDLTAREEEVLKLLARGQCNKTIARHLGIAVGTVKTHVKGIMAKLEASSRTEAASIAAEKGIVDVPEFRSRRIAWSLGVSMSSRERACAMHDALAVA